MRYSEELRVKGYRYLFQVAKRLRPDLEVGLCLETYRMFEMLDMQAALGRCNCVL